MKPLHYTASALALGLALMGNAQAVTTIPFWHSMEGELGKDRILWPNVLTPKTRITKLYRPIKATTNRI